jgi:hypothetical protein
LYKNPEKYIPKDMPYCYEYTGEMITRSVPWGLDQWGRKRFIDASFTETKPCIFHKNLWNLDLCMFNGSDCCMDSCKTCGINDYLD